MLETPARTPWTRVPYRWYTDADVYAREQERIFRGRAWNYAALACEIPSHGDFKTTTLGERPVVVAASTHPGEETAARTAVSPSVIPRTATPRRSSAPTTSGPTTSKAS